MSRLSWDLTWLTITSTVAQRSLCIRAKVGCVIVNSTNRVVATGYNGPPAGFQHHEQLCRTWCDRAQTHDTRSDYANCPALHAEANALMVCDRRDREGGTIYINGDVCFSCAKLIANSGLAAVVVHEQSDRSYRNSDEGYALLRQCGIGVMIINAEHH